MNELTPQGEFHHFQLVNSNGDIPFSISVLVHLNQPVSPTFAQEGIPISSEEVLQLHEELEHFDGDYIRAFKSR